MRAAREIEAARIMFSIPGNLALTLYLSEGKAEGAE